MDKKLFFFSKKETCLEIQISVRKRSVYKNVSTLLSLIVAPRWISCSVGRALWRVACVRIPFMYLATAFLVSVFVVCLPCLQ